MPHLAGTDMLGASEGYCMKGSESNGCIHELGDTANAIAVEAVQTRKHMQFAAAVEVLIIIITN